MRRGFLALLAALCLLLPVSALLLCTLEPHECAAVVASSGGGGVSLHLSERQAADAVQPDYGRLILWSCIWMALVILGSYVTIAVSNRKKRGKQEENR